MQLMSTKDNFMLTILGQLYWNSQTLLGEYLYLLLFQTLYVIMQLQNLPGIQSFERLPRIRPSWSSLLSHFFKHT